MTTARGNNSGRVREFHSRSCASETIRDMDLSGKTIAITGTTSGIGSATSLALAAKGAHVVMFNRNAEMSEIRKKQIIKDFPNANIDTVTCDLNSLQSVKTAVEEYLSKGWPLHALILNAGVYGPTAKKTSDNFESHFGVNHVANFLLARELLPVLRQSSPSRIVFVSSTTTASIKFKKTLSANDKVKILSPIETSESVFKLYSYSKLCEILTAFKIHRDEFATHGISTYAIHPGTMIGTDLTRSYGALGKIINTVAKPFTKTLPQGAATSVYCATNPGIRELSGRFWESCWDDEKSLNVDIARDIELQDALWKHTENLIDNVLGTEKTNL